MLRLFHSRKKYQDFGIHGVAELRFEMQTNGTMSRLERGEKKSGTFASTNYLFVSPEDSDSNSPYFEEIEGGSICTNAHAVYMQVEKYPPT